MDNGHIAGQILVDNGGVREIVEQNLAALQRAFEEAGLELGSLDIDSGDQQRSNDGDASSQGDQKQRVVATEAASRFEGRVESIHEGDGRHHQINLVA